MSYVFFGNRKMLFGRKQDKTALWTEQVADPRCSMSPNFQRSENKSETTLLGLLKSIHIL